MRAAEYGEVFTRRWVVDLILDLVGYVTERDLGEQTLIEPSCGSGAFLGPIIDRLIASAATFGRTPGSLGSAIRAVDLIGSNVELARKSVVQQLCQSGVLEAEARKLAENWIAQGDFLLHRVGAECADYVVGNPPYVRLEHMAKDQLADYRIACSTMHGRADIYVGFIEKGLRSLKPGGKLGFICADRWMHNNYGSKLRSLVADSYAVDTVITMHDVDAFESDVSAYPAVIVLRNAPQSSVVVVEADAHFGRSDAVALAPRLGALSKKVASDRVYRAARLGRWFASGDLWPGGSPDQLAAVAELESRFGPIEDPSTGTKVGIGVATGCDEVLITDDRCLIEEDRLLPLVRPRDVADGTINWRGSYLVNPWEDGKLVDLGQWPRLRDYLRAHRPQLERRYVARRHPEHWYRTIDRVDPSLMAASKLLLPDIKSSAHPILDPGSYYPHHNLYFLVSKGWDLEVLGGLLLSDYANLFVSAYCVKMRGGCFRFQAQYLRRIRVPAPRSIRSADGRALAAAFASRDRDRATGIAKKLYGLSLPALRDPS